MSWRQKMKHRWFGTQYVWMTYGHAGGVYELTTAPSGVELVVAYDEVYVVNGDTAGGRKIVRLT